MTVDRRPALQRPHHPADDIPEKPAATPLPPGQPEDHPIDDRLIEQHNVRIRPSTKLRLMRAVDRLRYETGDRTISAAAITDEALREYLDRRGC